MGRGGADNISGGGRTGNPKVLELVMLLTLFVSTDPSAGSSEVRAERHKDRVCPLPTMSLMFCGTAGAAAQGVVG